MERARPRDEANLSRVPVFVFPSTVYFNAQDGDHMKQILTIYNPYEFPIHFRVLSNASTFYNVRPDEATISSKNALDLIIKVNATELDEDSSTPRKHKFRIQIFHKHTKQQVGQRDVDSIIHFGNLPPHLSPSGGEGGATFSHGAEPFQQVPSGSMSASKDSGSLSSGSSSSMGIFPQTHSQPNFVVLFIAAVCIMGLCLPYEEQNCKSSEAPQSSTLESFLPTYLRLAVGLKLVLAYTLGLVTLVIFKP